MDGGAAACPGKTVIIVTGAIHKPWSVFLRNVLMISPMPQITRAARRVGFMRLLDGVTVLPTSFNFRYL
jgi:hypothetical protein